MSPERVSERKGTVIFWLKTEKAREPTVESLVRVILRLRVSDADHLKTVTQIKRSSARNTCIAKSIYLVMNSLWDWESVGKLKQRRDAVSFTCFQ